MILRLARFPTRDRRRATHRDPSTPRFQPSRDPWPSIGSSTTAAAPSPKRNALVRSSQFVIRVKVSAPITKTLPTPAEIRAAAVTSPYVNPAQVEIHGATTNSEGAGCHTHSPACSEIACQTNGPVAACRLRMPERSTIHSSLVSKSDSKSAFFTTVGGSAAPHQVREQPRAVISRAFGQATDRLIWDHASTALRTAW